MKSKSRSASNYGPVESENERVGTIDAETLEAKADAHGATALKRKRSGKVDGDKPKHRLDRRARGGKVGGKGVKVNIIVAPGAGGAPPMGAPMAPGAMPPPAAPPPMVRPPMPPPGPPMGSPGAGMPPPQPGMMRKAGGRVDYPKMTAGALGGEAKFEKMKAYGDKYAKSAKSIGTGK